MATNLNYSVGVSTTQGVQALNQLQAKVADTSNSFGKLKGALAGLAFGSFIANSFAMANALTDMAKAAGISTQVLLGFRDAVKANGGDAESAVNALGKFSQAIDGAANGSKDLQDKFLKLGVSLEDLRNLSEEALLDRVVKGLGQGKAGAENMATAMAFFGKQFRSVDFEGVAKDIDGSTKSAREAAKAYEAAGDAQQKFSNSIGKLQTELIKALTPVSDLLNWLLDFGEGVKIFARAAVQIALVVASFTILGKVIAGLRFLLVGLAEGWGAIAGAGSAVVNFFRQFGAISATVSEGLAMGGSRMGIFGGLMKEFGGSVIKAIPGLGALIGTILVLGKTLWDAGAALLRFLGIISDEKSATADAAEEARKKAEAQKKAGREVIDALAKEKAALDAILSAYRLQNKEANTKFKLDTDALHMSEAQKVLQEEQLSAYNRYLGEFNKLQDQFNEKKRSGSESDRAMLPAITATQGKLTAEYNKQKDAITSLVAERVKDTQIKQLELFQTKEMISAQDKLQTIQDEIAKSTLPEIQKKYYDIDAAAKASAKSAIEAEEARRNSKMPIEEQQKYYDAAMKGTEDLKARTGELYAVSRDFNTGWKNAFNDYVDNATNAASQAQRVFQTLTQSMEDMLMGFFKTGKFGWKDFVQSMIDVMMRSQIQQLIAKTFGGIGSVGGGGGKGGGGLFGGAIIPGFLAEGGPAGAGKPYIVGERGPELFVPNTSGTVVPNGALGGGGAVTYNINAVDAMSFKQMLAQDPTFLHAVAEQGRRRLPGAR